MPATLPTGWEDRFARASIRAVVLAKLDLGGGDIRSFCSGGEALFGYPNNLHEISPVGSELDVETRRVTVSNWEFIFLEDQIWRELMKNELLKNKKMTIQLGDNTLGEAFFFTMADNLVVDDVIPEPAQIKVSCLDPFGWGLEKEIHKYHHSGHPIRIFKDMALEAELPAAQVGDASLDSTLYGGGSHPSSHHVVSRHNYNEHATNTTVEIDIEDGSAVSINDQIQDLFQVTYASIFPLENGNFGYQIYDALKAVDHDWNSDDIVEFEQMSTWKHITNRMTVHGTVLKHHTLKHHATAEDSTAQTEFAYPGETRRIYEKAIKSKWLNGVQFYRHTLQSLAGATGLSDAGGAETLAIRFPLYFGFCGSNTETAGGVYADPAVDGFVQQAAHTLTAARPCFMMLTDGNVSETVRFDAMALSGASDPLSFSSATDPTTMVRDRFSQLGSSPSGSVNRTYWRDGVYSSVTRNIDGSGGGTPIDWQGIAALGGPVWVYDITIARYLCDLIIARFARGLAIVRLSLNLSEILVRLGDFGTIADLVGAKPGFNAFNSNIVWEVVGTEAKTTDDTPGMDLTLAWVRDTETAVGTVEFEDPPVQSNTPMDPEPVFDNSVVTVVDSLGATVFA